MGPRHCSRGLAARVCAAALVGGTASAQDLQGFQANLENDVFVKGGSDRWYTNGIRGSWSWNRNVTSAIGEGLRSAARWWLWKGSVPTLTYTFGQSMYTPADITKDTPQRYDRPWGAVLFAGATAHAARDADFRATELKLGWTGRHALGQDAQTAVHRYLTQSPRPAGWDQQLHGRPALQLSHTRVHRWDKTRSGDRWSFQTSWGLAGGTLRAYGNAGMALTVGDLVGADSPLTMANEGDFVIQDFDNRAQFRKVFGFVAVGVTGMVYNYFLQGDTPYGRAQIDRKPLVAAMQCGVSLPLHEWLGPLAPRVVYTANWRSPEFTSRLAGAPRTNTRYGGLGFYWDMKT